MREAPEQLALDGYIRISRVAKRRGPRFVSPAIQRDRIETFVATRGARLLSIFEDLDESGARADRPKLEAAIARIESGISDGFVVSKVSRFSRSLIDGLLTIERVRKAGGVFFSVEDGLDTTTDTGRMVLAIMLSLAEWDLDRIRASWDDIHAQAIARGRYPVSVTPVGYRKSAAGRLRPDPRTGPVITEIFRRRAQGAPLREIGDWLAAQGVLTSHGNRGWTITTLDRLIANRVYLGHIKWGSHLRERAHPPLTDPATWELAQRPRRVLSRPHTKRPLLLRGLVRCAGCSLGMPLAMRRRQVRGRQLGVYTCRYYSAAGHCPNPASIAAEHLEPWVETVALELLARRRRRPRAQLAQAEHALADTEAALAAYRDSDRILASLGQHEFAAGLAIRHERVREARLALAAVRARHAMYDLPPVADLERRWPRMTVSERRAILLKVLDCVFVDPGRLNIRQRITVFAAGTAPKRLPGPGNTHSLARPFHPTEATRRATATLAARCMWSHRRIERELRHFLADRDKWPTYDEFLVAGRSRLYQQIALGAGEEAWAHRLGLRVRDRTVPLEPWTTERIHAALSLYLADKTAWPTIVELERDGLHTLRIALMNNGGVKRWSQEFPLPRQQRVRWTEQRILDEVTPFCTDRDAFPTEAEFRRAGLDVAWRTVLNGRGLQWWANELGLPLHATASGASRP